MERREGSSENEQENTEREEVPCLTLISQSVGHPVAEDAVVTTTDSRCPYSAYLQEYYWCTQRNTRSGERDTYSGKANVSFLKGQAHNCTGVKKHTDRYSDVRIRFFLLQTLECHKIWV